MIPISNYPIYIFFGVLPSIIWLQFYLRRDVKPEPKSMILKIFFYGVLMTIPAIFIETFFFDKIQLLNFSPSFLFLLDIFLGVAFVEEFLKFLVIKTSVLNNHEFDEPIDAMIYMIIAALGFAAGENLLILLSVGNQGIVTGLFSSSLHNLWNQIFEISLLRFLGATFLHALSSAIIGFFIGLSFFKKEKRWKLIIVGLFLATLLHGLYNFSIITMRDSLKLFIPFLLLISSATFISFSFKKLKKIVGLQKENL